MMMISSKGIRKLKRTARQAVSIDIDDIINKKAINQLSGVFVFNRLSFAYMHSAITCASPMKTDLSIVAKCSISIGRMLLKC